MLRINVLGEEVVVTESQYKKECAKIFNDMEKINVKRLSIELMILEDTQSELMDGYDSSWINHSDENSKNWSEYLLEIWRIKCKIEHIKERIHIRSLNFNIIRQEEFDGLLSQFNSVKIT
jgi:hypothetical protein